MVGVDELTGIAAELVDAGCGVFPVGLSWNAGKGGIDKRPLTRHGHLDATTDLAELERLLAGARLADGEELGLGFCPGPAGYVALDCDVKRGAPGRETLARLEATHGEFARAAWTSPSGGLNVLCRKPAGARYGNRSPWPGVDVRADNGWLVAPGVSCSWGAWAWSVGELADAVELPPAMGAELDAGASYGSTASSSTVVEFIERSPETSALGARTMFEGRLAELAAVARTGGSRHEALRSLLGFTFALTQLDLRQAMTDVCDVWQRLVPGERRDHEPWDVARWTVAQELIRRNGDGATQAGEANGRSSPVTVTATEEFTMTEEAGTDALVGGVDDALIPSNGDVMIYGDGGAGKTTLGVDLAFHLATASAWLGIPVANAATVLLVENEGPRPLFRRKLRRKHDGWPGLAPGARLLIVEEPWAVFTFAHESHRAELACQIAEHEVDVVIVGPLTASGMLDAGTLQEVRAFIALCDDVRRRAGRDVTFVLVHHENKGGKVSGAWEGCGDTLIHVTGMGHGRTRMYVQKARWSSTWHAQTLDLAWTDGEGFDVTAKPEVTDDDVAERIRTAVKENPGVGWTRVEELTPGIRRERRRTLRDRLLADGELVNIVTENGVETALDHCPQGRHARLYLSADPTIAHLRPDPGADGAEL